MVEHSRQPNAPRGARQDKLGDDAEGGGERVAKALARAGVASRRDVERLIEEGRVALNGRVLDTPAVKVAPGDVLTVDGNVVGDAEPTRLWRYHKPTGLVTTHKDPQGRPTVFEHLPAGLPRVISVGRLDLNSEGLLLLTNDGGLARALELPSSGWVRRYRARAYGHTSQARLDTLKKGVTVEGVSYGPIDARLDKAQTKPGDKGKEGATANVWITVSLTEGKNREVRRVLESIGLKVNRLIRLSYGPFALGTLPPGAAEEIGPRVIREQLEGFVLPEKMPTGDRRPTPMQLGVGLPSRRTPTPPKGDGPRESGPARRFGASRPAEDREDARPSRPGKPGKPGQPRKAGSPAPFRREEASAGAKEKKAYKPGWAKPKPKPRPGGAGGRPKRPGARPPKAR